MQLSIKQSWVKNECFCHVVVKGVVLYIMSFWPKYFWSCILKNGLSFIFHNGLLQNPPKLAINKPCGRIAKKKTNFFKKKKKKKDFNTIHSWKISYRKFVHEIVECFRKKLYRKWKPLINKIKDVFKSGTQLQKGFWLHYDVQCTTHCLGMSYYVNFLEGLGSNEFHIKWRFGTHGSWKNQNPRGRFGATR